MVNIQPPVDFSDEIIILNLEYPIYMLVFSKQQRKSVAFVSFD